MTIEVLWNFPFDPPDEIGGPEPFNPFVVGELRGGPDMPYVSATTPEIAEAGRRAWRLLFLEVFTAEQLDAWKGEVPRYCNCQSFYEKYLTECPPEFIEGQLSFRWKWALKSAVNRKLGHADLTLEEARAFWASKAAE